MSPLGAAFIPTSQRFTAVSIKGVGDIGMIPIDCNECRPTFRLQMKTTKPY
jgi:hypothetical protein